MPAWFKGIREWPGPIPRWLLCETSTSLHRPDASRAYAASPPLRPLGEVQRASVARQRRIGWPVCGGAGAGANCGSRGATGSSTFVFALRKRSKEGVAPRRAAARALCVDRRGRTRLLAVAILSPWFVPNRAKALVPRSRQAGAGKLINDAHKNQLRSQARRVDCLGADLSRGQSAHPSQGISTRGCRDRRYRGHVRFGRRAVNPMQGGRRGRQRQLQESARAMRADRRR